MLITLTIAVWIATALADYRCHRRTGIEQTGLTESALHLFLIAQSAAGFAVAIFIGPTPWTAAFLVANLVLHAIASLIDITIAVPRRHVSAWEHTLHYSLNICPTIVVADYIAEYPIPSPTYTAGLFAAIAILVVIPYVEEFMRCVRWRFLILSSCRRM